MTDEFVKDYAAAEAGLTQWVFERQKANEAALLADYRLRLCDLLHGRFIRGAAAKELVWALELESRGAPADAVQQVLDRAAHWEWMATIAERGQVLWGQRNNRLGRSEDA